MHFEVKRARRGPLKRNQWVVVIVADNGRTLFRSETYNNQGDAMRAADLVNTATGRPVIVKEN